MFIYAYFSRRVEQKTQADIARTFGVDATTIGRLQPDAGRPFGLDGASAAA
jgi:hypothetical protein